MKSVHWLDRTKRRIVNLYTADANAAFSAFLMLTTAVLAVNNPKSFLSRHRASEAHKPQPNHTHSPLTGGYASDLISLMFGVERALFIQLDPNYPIPIPLHPAKTPSDTQSKSQ